MNTKKLQQHGSKGSALAFTLTALAWGMSPLPSQAQLLPLPPLVQCTGTTSLTFTPGLTNATQNVVVTIKESLPLCVNLLNPLDLLSAGTSQSQVPRTLSCNSQFGGGPGQRVISWTDNTQSTFNYVSQSNIINGQIIVVFTGNIVAGKYAGSSATAQYVLPTLSGTSCNTPEGLTSTTGLFTLNIL